MKTQDATSKPQEYFDNGAESLINMDNQLGFLQEDFTYQK